MLLIILSFSYFNPLFVLTSHPFSQPWVCPVLELMRSCYKFKVFFSSQSFPIPYQFFFQDP